MLKVGNTFCTVAVVYFRRIRLPSPIMLRMSGRMKRLFILTTSNDFNQFFRLCYYLTTLLTF